MKQIKASREILRNSQKRNFPYVARVFELEIEVHKGVFPIHAFNGWRIFTENFPDIRGKEVLEVGCGCGVTILNAANKGANRAVGVDINEIAVNNTRKNARANKLKVETLVSDIFDGLKPTDIFDIIYWNHPFLHVDERFNHKTRLEAGLFDPGYKMLNRFLTQSSARLKADGFVLLGFGAAGFGDPNELALICQRIGLSLKLILEQDSIETNPVKFQMYEIRP